MQASQKGPHIGRPTIYKKGPLTAAERQRRHRAKVRRGKREAEFAADRERNAAALHSARYQKAREKRSDEVRARERMRAEWLNMWGTSEVVRDAGLADELVRQLADAMLSEHIAVADIRHALDRRFGPEGSTG